MASIGCNAWQHQFLLLSVKFLPLALKSHRPSHLADHKPKIAVWRAVENRDCFCETLSGPYPYPHRGAVLRGASSLFPCPSSMGYECLCSQQLLQAQAQWRSFLRDSGQQGVVRKLMLWEMARLLKGWLCTHEDSSSTPRTHVKETRE